MIICLLFWNLLSIEDILFYQQNRYQKDRYALSMDIERRMMVIMILASLILFVCDMIQLLMLFYLMVLLFFPSVFKKEKVFWRMLVVTQRIMRLFGWMFLIDCLVLLMYWVSNWVFFLLLVLFGMLFHHFAFYLFILICDPIETRIKKHYVLRAKRKIDAYSGIKIAITGSYGKTSIKNLLYEVLSMRYACLKTPASYNNEMGICRTILEKMNHQEIFICEMGADHLHEIEDLCNFVQPQYGILCAVGPQHLSTFKTIENILHEKMKILECLNEKGMGFFNFDNFYLHHQPMELACPIQRVGIHSEADIKAIHLHCDHLGSQFDVMLSGKLVHFSTSLLGEHNILNCLFAIALAHHLGVEANLIQIAILNAKPTEHRLEMKPFYKGMCIDNAYNSNPDSAKMALQVLKSMPGRHFLVTPGFIDLGEHHRYYSRQFAKDMLFCDLIVLVGECLDIQEGLLEAGYDQSKIIHTSSMKDALVIMSTLLEEKDTMLIENDIPPILMNKKQSAA